MSDLIDRQAAIDLIESIETERLKGNIELIYAPAIKGLRALPPAQPERIEGHWIKISHANIYECSECGKSVMTNDICAYDFCHGCGADMRGELK